MIIIERLETKCSNRYKYGIDIDKSAIQAFPDVIDNTPQNNAYSTAMRCFDSSLGWCWLEWHRTQNKENIATVIGFLVERVRDVNKLAVNDGLRRLHDIFMLQAAILTGSQKVMNEAANLAGRFDPGSGRYAYEWGLVGVYRDAILGDIPSMRASYDLMMSSRPSPPYRMPLKSVVSAFVAKDDRKLEQALKRLWKSEWEKLEVKEKGVLDKSGDKIRVSLRQRGPNNLWPWPEAAFTKLAVIGGAKISGDPLWCPADFLKMNLTIQL